MLGNGNLDEAMHRDIRHPGHTSGGREAVGIFVFTCILSVIFFNVYEVNWLPTLMKTYLTLFLGVGIGLLAMKRIAGTKARKLALEDADLRKNKKIERDKQLAAMNEKERNNVKN